MTTISRLQLLFDHEIDFVCCTPTYALRMAEVAEQEHIDLAAAAVSQLIVVLVLVILLGPVLSQQIANQASGILDAFPSMTR